ncbi:hypothetical protein BZY95_13755 [Billgrantia desiderata SP1]|nr:hypothetical protein BZY95_13755 [Halomonas desiderata SP1]
MEIDRAVSELKIAQEFPPSLDNRWKIAELYQREIDKDRVRNDMVRGYLQDPNKIKFFNALTVVLLPKNSEGILDSFDQCEPGNPPIPYDGQSPIDAPWANDVANKYNLGGVQYVEYGDQARLRWDSETVHAVVVDGQHRLDALRQFKVVSGNVFNEHVQKTKVPVIFVLISEEVGFKKRVELGDSSIRAIAREIFTDLNKNAKEVDKARELILDDWSINAQCLRTLITDETAKDSDVLIPLSLIRWADSNNRFDSNYYLNSLVHIDQLINSVLDIRYPRDPLDKEQVVKYIHSLKMALGRESSSGAVSLENDKGKDIESYYNSEYVDTEADEAIMPFNRLPASFLNAAVENFESNHKGYILSLLTKFKPYEELIDYSRENNLIEGNFAKFFAQTREHQYLIREQKTGEDSNWYYNEIERHIRKIETMKTHPELGASWAYKALFQKSAIRVAKAISFEYSKSHATLGNIGDYLNFLNALYINDLLYVESKIPGGDVSAWYFIATNAGNGKIRVNKQTEKNITSFLMFFYHLYKLKESGDFDFNDALLKLRSKKYTGLYPGAYDSYNEIKKCFSMSNFYNYHYGRDKAQEMSDDEKKKRTDEFVSMYISSISSVF